MSSSSSILFLLLGSLVIPKPHRPLLVSLTRRSLSYHRSLSPTTNMSNVGGGGEHNNNNKVARFPMSPRSTLVIQMGDITLWSVNGSSDAIVNPANEQMLGGGGADGAIHRVAGPGLLDACYAVPEVQRGVRCPTGEARITPGFRLPAAYVIHTVGPIFSHHAKPKASLTSAYRNSLALAKENNIQYIAFTAISCGVYRYPFDEAATVAISTVKEFANDFEEVHFVFFSDDIYKVWLNKASELLEGKGKGYPCLGSCAVQ